MNTIQSIIESYQPAVIQIATPHGTGTGFYLKEYDLIITNYHVVENVIEAAVAGKNFEKRLSPVLYIDPKHDLAFLAGPKEIELPIIPLGKYETLKDGDQVLAIGHPYGLNYSATQGVISKVDRLRDGLNYIQIDAAINPGNSGGPLVNAHGEVIGVNSFIIKGGDNLGFALPVSYLSTALALYMPHKGTAVTRCSSCSGLVLPTNVDNEKYCPFCGTEVKLLKPSETEVQTDGVHKKIEDILTQLEKDVKLAREGQNAWSVKEGSATIKINYNTNNYFIVGDAYMCKMPEQPDKIKDLYQYLLQENFNLNGLVLSCNKQNIVLSCLIYDLDLTVENGVKTFKHLFQKADDYDDYLEKTFGCIKSKENEK